MLETTVRETLKNSFNTAKADIPNKIFISIKLKKGISSVTAVSGVNNFSKNTQATSKI